MIHHGDCLDVMAGMDPESVDAIVTDPPYGLEFMGKKWDRLGDIGQSSHAGPDKRALGSRYGNGISYSASSNRKCRACGHWEWSGTPCKCEAPDFPTRERRQGLLMQEWHQRWAEAAYRVAKPSAYLLAFGGTRTVHRMTCALEDAGWIVRDMLVWCYASGFPKSRASLKPAWESIVMARKPGPLRMLNIDECRIPMSSEDAEAIATAGGFMQAGWQGPDTGIYNKSGDVTVGATVAAGRWPANIVLTDPIFDGGIEGVVGGGETAPGAFGLRARAGDTWGAGIPTSGAVTKVDKIGGYDDSGTYSRFFLVPKAARSDREPVLGTRKNRE